MRKRGEEGSVGELLDHAVARIRYRTARGLPIYEDDMETVISAAFQSDGAATLATEVAS